MAERRFEHLLERCLQEVARTGDTEAVLRRYPQHADHLRPLLEVALATSQTFTDVPEPPGGLAAGRMRLLEAAARQRERAPATQKSTLRKETRPKMKLLLATRLISAILVAVIGTAAVGGGATLAASDSLPGDVLYPVKLAGEDLRLSLASNPEAQVGLALQFSDERITEIEAMVKRGEELPETVVARMERHVLRAMNQAAWTSEDEMPGLLKRIAERTQAQAQTLEQLQASAQEQNQVQLKNAQRVCQQAQEEAKAGLGDPQTFRSRYQHRENMPEDVTPPEPPTRESQNGEQGPGPQGPGGPNQDQEGPPQGKPQGDRDQDRDREDEPQQDQDRDQDRDREDDPQQDQDRDREDEPQQDQDQDRDRDRDGEDEPQQDQDRDQDRDRQQDQDQQQDQQQDQDQQPEQPQGQGGSGDEKPSGDPGSSPQGGKGSGNG
jgi:hypothetical protein